MRTKVRCYSGYTYAERPQRFLWKDKYHTVQAVKKEWREPGEKHFQVCTEDNKLFELCYDIQAGQWTLIELV